MSDLVIFKQGFYDKIGEFFDYEFDIPCFGFPIYK